METPFVCSVKVYGVVMWRMRSLACRCAVAGVLFFFYLVSHSFHVQCIHRTLTLHTLTLRDDCVKSITKCGGDGSSLARTLSVSARRRLKSCVFFKSYDIPVGFVWLVSYMPASWKHSFDSECVRVYIIIHEKKSLSTVVTNHIHPERNNKSSSILFNCESYCSNRETNRSEKKSKNKKREIPLHFDIE